MSFIARAWPPFMVATIVTFVYVVYMLFNLVPALEIATSGKAAPSKSAFDGIKVPSASQLWVIAGAFHALFAMLLVSFMRAAYTAPGSIPLGSRLWKNAEFGIRMADEEHVREMMDPKSGYTGAKLEAEREFLKSLPVVERKQKNGSFRYCSRCELYKPDRCHHCRICDACVLRMDHHCPWIANCVGFHNYKYFALLLLYAALSCLFIIVTMFPRMLRTFRPVLDTSSFVREDLPVVIAFVVCSFLFMALSAFFVFHMNLVMNSLSTIELREKKNSDNEFIQHRWRVAHMKFDRGSKYENFVHVFGSPWMWLIPIASDRLGTDGTYSDLGQASKTVENV
eukprot:TRINITY_DN65753_c6_g2_i1.p1 TRINITY_DN65753_c6_g2~~TRINITY_DN65753_c6_g2_i1.p1  ORF type:complete len:339 (+),score=170.02 TRINITY_DN65753_c6_g2_i1:49-1065(+)